jgi:hypothetical protein
MMRVRERELMGCNSWGVIQNHFGIMGWLWLPEFLAITAMDVAICFSAMADLQPVG